MNQNAAEETSLEDDKNFARRLNEARIAYEKKEKIW
jgi:hypothetical protein